MYIMKKVSSLLFVLIIVCCKPNKLKINNFDNSKWRNDSLGCEGFRYVNSTKIIDNKSVIIGSSAKQVIDYFGLPNSSTINNLQYYIVGSFQCDNKFASDSFDVQSVIFYLDDGFIKDIGIIEP